MRNKKFFVYGSTGLVMASQTDADLSTVTVYFKLYDVTEALKPGSESTLPFHTHTAHSKGWSMSGLF